MSSIWELLQDPALEDAASSDDANPWLEDRQPCVVANLLNKTEKISSP